MNLQTNPMIWQLSAVDNSASSLLHSRVYTKTPLVLPISLEQSPAVISDAHLLDLLQGFVISFLPAEAGLDLLGFYRDTLHQCLCYTGLSMLDLYLNLIYMLNFLYCEKLIQPCLTSKAKFWLEISNHKNHFCQIMCLCYGKVNTVALR